MINNILINIIRSYLKISIDLILDYTILTISLTKRIFSRIYESSTLNHPLLHFSLHQLVGEPFKKHKIKGSNETNEHAKGKTY